MTKVKLCGLSRPEDITAANELKPEYIGFVFAAKSKRYVTPKKASELRAELNEGIKAVGVFVNETIDTVAGLLKDGIIDMAQLHGSEDEEYIKALRQAAGKPIIKAFKISDKDAADEIAAAISSCSADYVLLDSGAGTGNTFDWNLIENIDRPYFLAGGLGVDNAASAREILHPYALDVSSGIETDGVKDKDKMAAFVAAARKEK